MTYPKLFLVSMASGVALVVLGLMGMMFAPKPVIPITSPVTSSPTRKSTPTPPGTLFVIQVTTRSKVTSSPAPALSETPFRTPSLTQTNTPITYTATITPTRTRTSTPSKTPTPTNTLTPSPYTLIVSKTGTGSGTVTSSPSGINCGSDCSETYKYNTVVTLTASASPGSTFKGWSGEGCSGTGACQVTMSTARLVVATFTINTYTLTVSKAGAGSGTVTSSPSGISCGSDCSQVYDYNTAVTLTASASPGSTFTGWGGACSGTGPCQVTMTEARSVTATFIPTYTLTVSKSGNGTVTSSPSGISCGSDCTEDYIENTVVTLTASASSGSIFTGWGGACSGTGACQVTMTTARSVTATFIPNYILTVSKAGTGNGTVTSSPSGINCGSDCSENYNENTFVTLTASASPGSTFTGWGGACSGTGSCQVTMSAARSVTATFMSDYNLIVSKTGAGSGTVSSSPTGIECGSDCSEVYSYNTFVTLTATASPGSTFRGWSGACSGTGSCQVTMTNARFVTARFTLNTYTLTVSVSGPGSGAVTSSPSGIDCGSDCTENYLENTVVTLTASAFPGSTFTEWSGACSGTDPCQVIMTDAWSVTATFTLIPTDTPVPTDTPTDTPAPGAGGGPGTEGVTTPES